MYMCVCVCICVCLCVCVQYSITYLEAKHRKDEIAEKPGKSHVVSCRSKLVAHLRECMAMSLEKDAYSVREYRLLFKRGN
jgi:hypothetical protein